MTSECVNAAIVLTLAIFNFNSQQITGTGVYTTGAIFYLRRYIGAPVCIYKYIKCLFVLLMYVQHLILTAKSCSTPSKGRKKDKLSSPTPTLAFASSLKIYA